ncbi:major facilitator superfamily domain-containing protein [Phyllosticta citribraziliensis]|uniref:Lysosomal dipeptide transporter MFSD1 n=1 Tax=Phyllosticta citribraziliensis TaxID=989973 RepID=A0ABR1MBC6_9PEZI
MEGDKHQEKTPSTDLPEESLSGSKVLNGVNIEKIDGDEASISSGAGSIQRVPKRVKVAAVFIVTLIGFTSHWSSELSSAMKSTIKKELRIDNSQFAILTSSENFVRVTLILGTGILTDRLGGVDALLLYNIMYFVGTAIIAAGASTRSFNTMVGGTIIQALGDMATQCAQYKIFSSWFPPSGGFATTLGVEIGIGKVGSFVGKSSANIIAKNTGDFKWVYWVALLINLFTVCTSVAFLFFKKRYSYFFFNNKDPATGERLKDSNKRFDAQKMLQLPWTFWAIMLFSLFYTSTAMVFNQNATELAEQRFHVSAITAGWYSSMSQFLGFFLTPLLGMLLDVLGNRLTAMTVCGSGLLVAMALCAWGPGVSGTAAAFGVYAFASALGMPIIIDSTRTTMWYQEVFGSAYAIKIAIANAVDIIIRIVTGLIQDADGNSYNHVVIVYVVMVAGALVAGWALLISSCFSVDLMLLQWTRKQRLRKGETINAEKLQFEEGTNSRLNRRVSLACFASLLVLMAASWAVFFWAIATGHSH